MMNPKEELIQAIERSPDDLVRVLLELLKVLHRQQSQEASSSCPSEIIVEKPNYDFSDLTGRLTWQGNAVTVQKDLRNEW